MKRGVLRVVFKLVCPLAWADKGKYEFQSGYLINQKRR
jgi:hypothetical protein